MHTEDIFPRVIDFYGNNGGSVTTAMPWDPYDLGYSFEVVALLPPARSFGKPRNAALLAELRKSPVACEARAEARRLAVLGRVPVICRPSQISVKLHARPKVRQSFRSSVLARQALPRMES